LVLKVISLEIYPSTFQKNKTLAHANRKIGTGKNLIKTILGLIFCRK